MENAEVCYIVLFTADHSFKFYRIALGDQFHLYLDSRQGSEWDMPFEIYSLDSNCSFWSGQGSLKWGITMTPNL